jgi:hypothetical protein
VATGLVKTKDNVTHALNEMIKRRHTVAWFLEKHTFAQYKAAQLKRWPTNNVSEGHKWDDLDPKYAERKLIKCATMPGAGRQIMVRTGKLVDAAIGKSADLLRVVTNSGIRVYIDSAAIPYGHYAADRRPIMAFGKNTKNEMITDLTNFIMRGNE